MVTEEALSPACGGGSGPHTGVSWLPSSGSKDGTSLGYRDQEERLRGGRPQVTAPREGGLCAPRASDRCVPSPHAAPCSVRGQSAPSVGMCVD